MERKDKRVMFEYLFTDNGDGTYSPRMDMNIRKTPVKIGQVIKNERSFNGLKPGLNKDCGFSLDIDFNNRIDLTQIIGAHD